MSCNMFKTSGGTTAKNKNWANETSFATPIPSISLLNQERKVSKIKGETGLPCLSPRSSGKLGPSMVLVFTFAFVL